MSADTFVGTGLQSGFVVAVLIAAVLLANKLGGSAALAQRACQVALGVALMMLVFSATAAFHGPQDLPLEDLAAMLDFDDQFLEMSGQSAQRNSEVGTIHIGLGLIFVMLGVVLLHRLKVIAPSMLLGGVLLILLGAPSGGSVASPLNVVFGLLGGVMPGLVSETGNARDIARFVVLLVGVVLLAVLIHLRWDGGSSHHGEGAVDS